MRKKFLFDKKRYKAILVYALKAYISAGQETFDLVIKICIMQCALTLIDKTLIKAIDGPYGMGIH